MVSPGYRWQPRNYTKATRALHDAIEEIVHTTAPTTVRSVFYVAVTRSIPGVPKTEAGVGKVASALKDLRYEGRVSWDEIRDSVRDAGDWGGWADAREHLASVAYYHRRNPWADQPDWVEVWCESRSIASIISDTCNSLDLRVPLTAFGGTPSLSLNMIQVEAVAERFATHGQRTHVLYLGDLDPTGMSMDDMVQEDLGEFCPTGSWTFERIGIKPTEVSSLVASPTPLKSTDPRTPGFRRRYGLTVGYECEAIPPTEMRQRVHDSVTTLIEPTAWADALEAEAEDRTRLHDLISEL